MLSLATNSILKKAGAAVVGIAVTLAVLTTPAFCDKKKKKDADKPKPNLMDILDLSKIVWPNPPAIARIRYMNYFCSQKPPDAPETKKAKWMDRLAGVAVGEQVTSEKRLWQLVTPYGLAVDSKNRLYVADSKVHAIFIFDTETKELQLIKNGVEARFGLITGLAIDDSDRLFVSDSEMRRVMVFDPTHKAEGSISEGLANPAGMAIDNENRFLYVADSDLDQVLVYDADPPHKLLRKIGTTGKGHTLTASGDFSKPTNVAVDKEGLVYVTDTWNDRVEIFDPDGKFIRTWGKAGDGPGYFARPKGIAIDGDGHVWVADSIQDRVQVFTPEGQLLIWMGGHGAYPGQFNALAGITIDKNNRVFTSEQYAGRVQMFRYVTDAEALAEKGHRQDQEQKKAGGAKPATTSSLKSAAAKSGEEVAAKASK